MIGRIYELTEISRYSTYVSRPVLCPSGDTGEEKKGEVGPEVQETEQLEPIYEGKRGLDVQGAKKGRT